MASTTKNLTMERNRRTVANVTSAKAAEQTAEATVCSQSVGTPDKGLTLEEALRQGGINERTIAKGVVSLHGKLIRLRGARMKRPLRTKWETCSLRWVDVDVVDARRG
jgi:hypothetical protein